MRSAWGLVAVIALLWARPPLAAAELCLPALAEGTRSLNRRDYAKWGRINPLL